MEVVLHMFPLQNQVHFNFKGRAGSPYVEEDTAFKNK